MLIKLLAIALGGGVGALLRFAISRFCSSHFGNTFPWGTFVVNIIGCFFIGLLATLIFERDFFAPAVRLFLVVGLIGGLTTFSTFSFETFTLLREGSAVNALLNVGGNVILGVAGTFLGVLCASAFFRA